MLIPRLSHETVAEMVGTTRSRVGFFINRFRKLAFINYDVGNHLRVNSFLLTVVLQDDDRPDFGRRQQKCPPTSRAWRIFTATSNTAVSKAQNHSTCCRLSKCVAPPSFPYRDY
jgi:hypothetical protein